MHWTPARRSTTASPSMWTNVGCKTAAGTAPSATVGACSETILLSLAPHAPKRVRIDSAIRPAGACGIDATGRLARTACLLVLPSNRGGPYIRSTVDAGGDARY